MEKYRVKLRVTVGPNAGAVVTVELAAAHQEGARYRAFSLFAESVIESADGLELVSVEEV